MLLHDILETWKAVQESWGIFLKRRNLEKIEWT